jgi:hypothetical protein
MFTVISNALCISHYGRRNREFMSFIPMVSTPDSNDYKDAFYLPFEGVYEYDKQYELVKQSYPWIDRLDVSLAHRVRIYPKYVVDVLDRIRQAYDYDPILPNVGIYILFDGVKRDSPRTQYIAERIHGCYDLICQSETCVAHMFHHDLITMFMKKLEEENKERSNALFTLPVHERVCDHVVASFCNPSVDGDCIHFYFLTACIVYKDDGEETIFIDHNRMTTCDAFGLFIGIDDLVEDVDDWDGNRDELPVKLCVQLRDEEDNVIYESPWTLLDQEEIVRQIECQKAISSIDWPMD